MTIPPIVLHMIVCDAWQADENNGNKVDIFGWTTRVVAKAGEKYPLYCESMTVFLWLTNGHGSGDAMIVMEMEGSDLVVARTPVLRFTFDPDPLHIVGVPIEIRDCYFPHSGVCMGYDDQVVHELPIRVR